MTEFDNDAARLRAFQAWFVAWIRREANLRAGDLIHAPTAEAANDLFYAAPPSASPWVLWTCAASDDPWHGFQATLVRLYRTIRQHPELQACRLVLASPDDLGDPSLYGVEVFDAAVWMEHWELGLPWTDGVAARLKRRLRQTMRGGGAALGDLGALARDTLRFLFTPNLRCALAETGEASVHRPDARFVVGPPGPDVTGPWAFPDGGVIVEAAQAPTGTAQSVYQLAVYLDAAPQGALGVLFSRRDLSAEALRVVHTCAHRGLRILPLTAEALVALIDSQLAMWDGRTSLGALAALGAIERAHWARLRA